MDKILNARLLAGVAWAAFFLTMGGMVTSMIPADMIRGTACVIFFGIAAFSSIVAAGPVKRMSEK